MKFKSNYFSSPVIYLNIAHAFIAAVKKVPINFSVPFSMGVTLTTPPV